MYNSHIKTFILVADRGSLSKAAEDLFVTSASIMKQMNTLEDHLNLKLLKRTNQGVELTDAGRYIYDAAKKIITESENAVQKARAIEQRSMKTICIGSSFLNPDKVLLDLWNKVTPSSTEYRFKIIPYDDYHDQILSVVQSLGSKLDETHYFYDLETFNTCEVTGSLLLTLDAWADIHPSLITLPVEWDFSVPYGLLFSRNLSDEATSFLNDIKNLLSTNEYCGERNEKNKCII